MSSQFNLPSHSPRPSLDELGSLSEIEIRRKKAWNQRCSLEKSMARGVPVEEVQQELIFSDVLPSYNLPSTVKYAHMDLPSTQTPSPNTCPNTLPVAVDKTLQTPVQTPEQDENYVFYSPRHPKNKNGPHLHRTEYAIPSREIMIQKGINPYEEGEPLYLPSILPEYQDDAQRLFPSLPQPYQLMHYLKHELRWPWRFIGPHFMHSASAARKLYNENVPKPKRTKKPKNQMG